MYKTNLVTRMVYVIIYVYSIMGIQHKNTVVGTYCYYIMCRQDIRRGLNHSTIL